MVEDETREEMGRALSGQKASEKSLEDSTLE